MKAAGATPAELWLSASEKAAPPELVEAHFHERVAEPRAFTLPEHLRDAADDFASDWDSWAGAPADASASGSVGGGASVDLFRHPQCEIPNSLGVIRAVQAQPRRLVLRGRAYD